MHFEDLQRRVRGKPFKPFRMHLTEGSIYEIRHPELVLLGRRNAVIGLAANPTQLHYDRAVDVDLMHVVKVEDIETQPSGNGQLPT